MGGKFKDLGIGWGLIDGRGREIGKVARGGMGSGLLGGETGGKEKDQTKEFNRLYVTYSM